MLLAGHTWKVNHLDWKRRIAHVEPVQAAGVARWQGAGAGISQTLARSARTVLAGADPAGVMISKRADAQLGEIRHEFSWAREGATSIVRDHKGRVRWWTFAGDLPDQWLAGSLDEARHSTKSVTGLSISFGEGVTLEDARVATRGITEQSLALGATVATDAVNGLKFSELLPPGVAERVVLTRLDRRADAVTVLDEPVTSAAE